MIRTFPVRRCASMKNRRNYYRVLQVQPGCPPEVIRASYRALMGTLRLHPDLGGDHEQAALVNEAYAVLGDPERRRVYDQLNGPERLRDPGGRTAGAAARPAQPRAPAFDPTQWMRHRCCPRCRTAWPEKVRNDTRCGGCDAALAPAPGGALAERERGGRRGAARRLRNTPAELHVGWPAQRVGARWRDLSLSGLCVHAPVPVEPGSVVRVADAVLDATALVVSCRRERDGFVVHARMLTARFERPAGVFVSARA